MKAAFLLALSTRCAVVIASCLSLILAEPESISSYATGLPLVAWDSVYYRTIMLQGYPEGITPYSAFFPAYPALARPLSIIGPEIALLIVSNLATVIAAIIAYSWASQIAGRSAALMCLCLLLAYPPAVFCAAAYTEGLFLLLVAASLYHLLQEDSWMAAACAGVATACRPTGLAIALVVVLSSLRTRIVPGWTKLVLLTCLAFSGLIGYQGYLWAKYDDPQAYLVAQGHWSAGSVAMEEWLKTTPVLPADVINKACVLVILGTAVAGLIRPGQIPRLIFLIPILLAAPAIAAGGDVRMMSLARFETAAIPCFLLAGTWLSTRPRLGYPLIAILFAIQLVYAWEFSRGKWLG